MSTYSKTKLGFSLLEISIVILVIALLVIAVSEGSRILNDARIKSAKSLTSSSPVNFTPNIILWVETTMNNSLLDDEKIDNSGKISIWKDINPQNTILNSATQTNNNNKPTYIKSAINNLPALRFDGNDYLNYNGNLLVNKNYTIFVVEQRRAGGVNLFLGGTHSGTNRNLILGYGTETLIAFAQYANDYHIPISSYSKPIPRIHSFRFSSSKGKNYFLNGENKTMQPASGANPYQGLIAYNGAAIGHYRFVNFFRGDIGEIIIFDRYLNDFELNNIYNYLSQKWQI